MYVAKCGSTTRQVPSGGRQGPEAGDRVGMSSGGVPLRRMFGGQRSEYFC